MIMSMVASGIMDWLYEDSTEPLHNYSWYGKVSLFKCKLLYIIAVESAADISYT